MEFVKNKKKEEIDLPFGEDVEQKDPIIDDNNEEMLTHEETPFWCSWCFCHTLHRLISKRFCPLLRDVYQCNRCFNLTKHCRLCKEGMAKKFPTYDDKFCACCDKSIKAWGDFPPEWMEIEANCSWCLAKSKHTLQQKNIIKRNVYRCQMCSKATVPCLKCKEQARDPDAFCLKCYGKIKSWEDVDSSSILLKREGWCSWCFENSNHTLERFNVVRRSVFTCEHCSMRTLPCLMCEDGMTRGGPTWDDSICASCARETGNGWEDIQQQIALTISIQRIKERVIAELSRNSKYREKAIKQGIIRPFLFLVAMPPLFRNQVAGFLGWTMYTKKYFGDPHQEAWEILNGTYTGMQSRSNKSYEKLNPLASNSNWYDILVRVTKASFSGKDMDYEISNKKILEFCRESKESFIAQLEEEFLSELSKLTLSHMTEERRQELENLLVRNEAELLKRMFTKNGGITRSDVMTYAFNLAQSIVSSTLSATGITSILISQVAALLPAELMVTTGLLVASLSSLSTPLFVLGILGLGFTSIKLIFGSSEGRLFVPVIYILNQRLLLAAEGIRIEDYY